MNYYIPMGSKHRTYLPKKWMLVMKLTTILLISSLLQVSASGLAQQVTLSVKNASLKTVFKNIRAQTGYNFVYDSETIKTGKPVTLQINSVPLEKALNICFENQVLAYEIKNNTIIVKKKEESLIIKVIDALTPPQIITGKITDENGNTLPGVTIRIKGENTGISSRNDGTFSVTVPDENTILVFSYIGYKILELKAGRGDLVVTMVQDISELNQVIVVGYGTQKRENVIGSVSQISADQIANRPVTQVRNVLAGQMSGVTVIQRSGQPGAETGSINIRGEGSFGASAAALILVDGIPVSNYNDLDPNTIESISVLKDASSAAIYGARAANGVVLITTKLGKVGKTHVSYSGYTGFQHSTALPEFLSSWEYALAYNEAAGSQVFSDAAIQKYKDGSDPDNFPNTDFLNEVLVKNSIQTNHSLSLSGGAENNQYNLTLGYFNQQGVIANNNFSHYNVRMNMKTRISPKFEVTTRLSVIPSARNEPTLDALGVLVAAMNTPGIYAGQLSNGDFGPGINSAGTVISALASQSSFKQRDLSLNGNIRLDYKVIPDLKLSFITAYDQAQANATTYRASQRINSTLFLNTSYLSESANTTGYYTLQGLGEYNKTIGKHRINFLSGYSFEDSKSKSLAAIRSNYANNDLQVLNTGSPENMSNSGTKSEWALESQFARLNYGFANKYLVEGVVRRDGSSRFPVGQKYGVFPSLAIGWRVGEEGFIKNHLSFISELRLKASRGVLGNQNIGNYAWQNTLVSTNGGSGTNYFLGNTVQQGVQRQTLVDSTLHWESTRTTDIGLDFGLFANKITGSATFYNRYTYDILVSPSASVSNVLGFSLSETNSGKLRNSGMEFTLNYANKAGKFSYFINSNFTITNNKVLDLGVGNVNQPNGLVGNGTLFIGQPMQLYYGYLADGIFKDAADITEYSKTNLQTSVNPSPEPGDIRYRDVSGPNGMPDGKVDAIYDRVPLGSRIPKYSYGLNLGTSFKGFDFSVLFQGVSGVKGYLGTYNGLAFNNFGNIQRWQYEERWSAANPDPNAAYPRLEIISNSGTPNTLTSSFWVLNGSYMRIKNLQLGYTLPAKVLSRIKFTNARIYVSGENLKTFSNYRQGWDPEFNGGDGYYPMMANFTFGLNLTL